MAHMASMILGLSHRHFTQLTGKNRQQILLVAFLVSTALWLSLVRYRQIQLHENVDPPLKLSPIPTFRHVSVYRRAPDVIFENFLDSVLVNLKLSYAGSYDKDVWPKKVFQTAKKVDKKYMKAVSSWSRLNPEHEHVLMNDVTAKEFVEKAFLSAPQVVHLYNSFPNPVLKADLLRYLLLYLYGGVYADIDVYCRKPIAEWLPEKLWKSDADIIVGVEIDEPYAMEESQKLWGWHRPFGFAQYTIVSKPFARPVRTAIVRVVAHAHHLAKLKNKANPALLPRYSAEDIYEISGPGVWTDALIDSMNYKRKDISWAQFYGMTEPTILPTEGGAVMALPIQYFGNGQKHSNASNYSHEQACVTHLFTKGWKRNSWFL
ncbi:hypothetical protein V1508DRAFT_414554 [Lipomyces doorenjongii]|uniref:uncharacterized protein n=1 Tax=Lipomyces doorenjongii TaxID=383834 RepID=UPI0034CE5FFF